MYQKKEQELHNQCLSTKDIFGGCCKCVSLISQCCEHCSQILLPVLTNKERNLRSEDSDILCAKMYFGPLYQLIFNSSIVKDKCNNNM